MSWGKDYLINYIIVLCIVSVLSLLIGSKMVPPEQFWSFLTATNPDNLYHTIIAERMPRTVFGLLAGGALSLSGALMQSVTRNPIADPSVLGINAGAALSVVIGIAFFHLVSPFQYIAFALVGAILAAILVYQISSFGQYGLTPIKLVLAGVVLNAAFSSMTSMLLLPRTEALNAFRFWQVGSISGASWLTISSVLPFIIAGGVIAFCIAPALSTLMLGDDAAVSLGIHTWRLRTLCMASGIMLCAAITALAGPIAFVGLVAPHLVRLKYGGDLQRLLPRAVFVGAILLLVSDIVGRRVGFPGELASGIVTSFIGAPVMIHLAMRMKGQTI